MKYKDYEKIGQKFLFGDNNILTLKFVKYPFLKIDKYIYRITDQDDQFIELIKLSDMSKHVFKKTLTFCFEVNKKHKNRAITGGDLTSNIYHIGYTPEFSIVYNNTIFLLNRRCCTSTIRGAIFKMNNMVDLEEYEKGKSFLSKGWDFSTTLSLDETKEYIKLNNPRIIMFYRDPIKHFISCINIYRALYGNDFWLNNRDIIDRFSKMNSNIINIKDKESHLVTQSTVIDALDIDFNSIIYIKSENIKKFFKQEYNFNVVQNHITMNEYGKLYSENDFSIEEIYQIKCLYKRDYDIVENYKWKT